MNADTRVAITVAVVAVATLVAMELGHFPLSVENMGYPMRAAASLFVGTLSLIAIEILKDILPDPLAGPLRAWLPDK